MRHIGSCVAGTLLLGQGSVFAQVDEADFFDDLPVVLSASRLSQPLADAPAAVTVIDRDMIRASGFRDIPDLLRLVPGFSVAYTRDNTWAVGYHGLADAYSRRFQVLVDGRSIYSPHFGAVHWSDLPIAIEDIERIEVVRGPNAAVYGSNAFLAVINIITQSAAQARGGLASMQYGDQGMSGLVARYGGGDEGLNWRVTLSSQNRDRFEAVGRDGSGDPQYLRERSRTYFLSGRTDWQISSRDDLSLQWGVSDGNWHGGREGHADEPDRQDSAATFLHLQFHRATTVDNEWRAQVYYTRNRFDANSVVVEGPFVVPVDQYLSQTRLNVDLQATQRVSEALRMLWGLEWRRESVDSPQAYYGRGALRGELARLSGNLEWRASNDWLVQGGALVEHHHYTGTDVSPRLALNYTVRPGHTLRSSISQAYRSPTFFEQDGNQVYTATDGSVVETIAIPAATQLSPERLVSREIGYVGQIRTLALNVNARLFSDILYDYIGSQKLESAACYEPVYKCFQSVNGSSLNLRGWEAELHWRPLRRLDLYAQYARVRIGYRDTVLDARGKVVDDDLPFSAPRNNFGMLASYGWGGGWQASAGVYRTDGVMWLSDGDVTEGYTRVDARLARHFKWRGDDAEWAVVAQSIDKRYSEFRVENTFGPKVYASISVGW
ncbi:MAG: TonB-dependent receptor plug domain-containing protein [Thiobacillus sp.]